MPPASASRTRLLLAALAVAAFGATIFSGFHFDDYYLLSDPAITLPSGWWRVWLPRETRPLTWLTYWLNYRIGGVDPMGYHLVNLALHVTVVLVLFDVLSRLVPAKVAAIAAGLFAIHPMQTEAVAYIFARGTLLCTLFCLLSLRWWLKQRVWIAALFFAIALLCKEECVAFPLFLLLLSSRERAELRAVAAMLFLAACAGLRTIYVARLMPGSGVGSAAGVSPAAYLLVQGTAILRYLRLLVIPWGFTVDPDLRDIPQWLEFVAWAGVFSLVYLAIRYFGRARAGMWLLGGLILLLPSSSIFPAADLAADRRMYLPMIAFAVVPALIEIRREVVIGLAAVLLALTFGQTRVWSSEASLWSNAVERAPHKLRPRIQLARTMPPDRALALLQEARPLGPSDPGLAAELGRIWMELGNPANALGEFGRALALAPRDPHAFNNRGGALKALGQDAAAKRDFEQALKLDPCLAEARHNLGLAPCE